MYRVLFSFDLPMTLLYMSGKAASMLLGGRFPWVEEGVVAGTLWCTLWVGGGGCP
jgi:hypothetical protein